MRERRRSSDGGELEVSEADPVIVLRTNATVPPCCATLPAIVVTRLPISETPPVNSGTPLQICVISQETLVTSPPISAIEDRSR